MNWSIYERVNIFGGKILDFNVLDFNVFHFHPVNILNTGLAAIHQLLTEQVFLTLTVVSGNVFLDIVQIEKKTITGMPFSSQRGFLQNHTVRMSFLEIKKGTWFGFL